MHYYAGKFTSLTLSIVSKYYVFLVNILDLKRSIYPKVDCNKHTNLKMKKRKKKKKDFNSP